MSDPMLPGGERRLTDHGWIGDDEGHNCLTCQDRDDSFFLCWPQGHVCSYCEKAPNAWPDVMCGPCRAEVEATTDKVHDPVEQVLSAHWRMEPLSTEDSTICRCGWRFNGGRGFHRRHLAEMIYDALDLDGPLPWTFGAFSVTAKRFGASGRILPDEVRASDEQEER